MRAISGRAAALALVGAAAACQGGVVPIGGPVTMVGWNGESYALRVVPYDTAPVALGQAPGLSVQSASTRIVAPDRATALQVYGAHCSGAGDMARWDGVFIPFDKATGEYVIPGGCS